MATATKHTQRLVQWYGWQPDYPDQRDHLYAQLHVKPALLPPRVDLRADCSPIDNQHSLGSCTAHALTGALEYLTLKANEPLVDLSRLFVYYNERVIEGSVAHDAGAALRDGIKTLARQGVCQEARWPYKIRQFKKKPPKAAYMEARQHRIRSYQRLKTLDDMRGCLAAGYPFVFGFTVYGHFESKAVAKTGVLQLPKRQDKPLGGHAVLAVGYDERSKRFLVRNSWGSDWGQHGYFTMPYDYLANRDLADDFWTIRR